MSKPKSPPPPFTKGGLREWDYNICLPAAGRNFDIWILLLNLTNSFWKSWPGRG